MAKSGEFDALKFMQADESIIKDKPGKFYDLTSEEGDGEEIGRGKFAIVCKATSKKDGKVYAAKMIYFDDDAKFAEREYTLMKKHMPANDGLVKLHEAYLVRKYLILIIDLVDGETLVESFCKRHSATEDDVAVIVRQLCEILSVLHTDNIVHLDIRPTNIRFEGRDIRLVDYNASRKLANKTAGAVVDVIGDTEFCAPEMLSFDSVMPGTDMWSVAVLTYILLSGISPFYYEDEDQVLQCVSKVVWKGKNNDWPDAFDEVSTEAKDFINKLFIRIPEKRLTAQEACKHPWLSSDLMSKRKKSNLSASCLEDMKTTDERLLEEEEEDYTDGSFVFRTFTEEEYDSPVEDDDDDDE